MAQLVTWLREVLQEALRRQGRSGLVVWYDEGGTLESVTGRATPEGAKLLPFEGSYLALRFELEGQDPDLKGRWVVYVPERAPKEAWLRDWELLGQRLELDLLELLHHKANLNITSALRALLRNRPENACALARAWDLLVGGQPITETVLENALLALAFGFPRWQLEEALLLFLSGQGGERLMERGLWEVWLERVRAWTGWEGAPEDERALRNQLGATVLLSELASFVPYLAGRLREILPSEARRPSVAALAKRWRDSGAHRRSYEDAARRIERDYELQGSLAVSEPLLQAETFPCIDELWRREVHNAVSPDGRNFAEKAPRIARIAEARRELFWARQGAAPYWQPITLAAGLTLGCQAALEESERLSSVEEFIGRYSDDEGWWRLDLMALRLAGVAGELEADERRRMVRPAWQAYKSFLDEVNRRFARAVEEEGWQPTHLGFWSRFVTGRRRTAIFFVDALRYDLARRVCELLPGEEFEVKIHTLRGVLPSVTQLGMAVVLPGAERGLFVEPDGGLRVKLGEAELNDRQGRQAYLEACLGARARVVDLSELERTKLEGIERLVVLSREVDEFGPFIADLPQGLSNLLERLKRAIQWLRGSGFERFLVVTDHGFLSLPSEEVQPRRLPAPMALLRKRRFAVGAQAEGCLVRRASELGLQGDAIFAFPIGLAVFAIQGELEAFLHGGLSLQEAIVPVIEVEAMRAPVAVKVPVKMEVPEALTSRIAIITVQVAGRVDLFARPRRVVVEIHGRRSEVVELSVQQRKAQASISWLEFDEEPPESATLRLLDVDTNDELDRRQIPVRLVV